MLDWLTKRPAATAIALLRAEHAPCLAALHAQSFARPWSSLEFERLLTDRQVLGDGLFLNRESRPAGFALSRRVLDEAEILTLLVDAKARGRGYSSLLLREHLAALALVGVRRVHLEVDEGNVPALALYRRFGFREEGRRVGYYTRVDGSRATALTMKAEL